MKQLSKRLLALCLMVALLGTLVIQASPVAQAADFMTSLPQKHYGDYGTVNIVSDQGNCYSMQGVAVDADYTYCAKIGSNDAVAMIVRLRKSDGAKTNMTNASNGGSYFYNLGHANALDLVTINGVPQMFVTGGANLIRLTMSGTTLTTAGTYTFRYNGATTNTTAVQVMYASAKEVKVITKGGKSLYTGTLDPTASSGVIELTHLCNLDITNVRLKGEMHDYSTWTQQGFDYCDGKVFLPLTGNAVVETINHSVVLVYDVEGASGTIRNDPTLSFRVISGTYAGLFEIEDVEVCDQDGKLYFSTNRRKTESDTNYDAVSFFAGYVYDPAMGTIGPSDYRWETINDEWVSVLDGGNTFNNPIRVSGAIDNGTMSTSVYHMSRSVVLKHNKPWVVEWQSSGGFGGGGMLLSGGKTSVVVDEPYVFRYANSTFISMGYYDGTQHNNYGIKLSDHGIDGIAQHVYRLTNKIASDGSNMVYLSIDGKELGALNNYYIGLKDQYKQVNWVSGKDLTFSYQGTLTNSLNQCKLDYMQVWADGVPAEGTNRYRWETTNNDLTSVTTSGYTQNTPIIYNGSVSGTTYSSACFRLTEPVVLRHDRQWSVQWEYEGALSGGTFLLSAGEGGRNPGAPFLFRYGSNLIFLGAHDGAKHANFGIDLSEHDIDGTAKHTYCLRNKIASNGSNMVYLYVDGQEVGPMNNAYSGTTNLNTTSDWLNGRDLVFDYVGNRSYSLNGTYSYLQVTEDGCSHSYTAVVTAPTCLTKGYTTYTCIICGDSYQADETPVAGHNYKTVTVDATCTKAGSVTKTCSVCGDKQVETIPVKSHTYSVKVTKPSCTEAGYTIYTCSGCGYSMKDSETPALGHSYKKTIIDPNCTNPGYTAYTCTVCGDHYAADETAATGHSYKTVRVEPTCTTAGSITSTCSDCGATQIETIAVLGHSYKSVAVEPTCTTGGYTVFTCTVCGSSYTTNQVAALGHSYIPVVTKPTCTTGGYTTYTCFECGDTYTADAVAPLAHSYNAAVTKPTCTTGGYTIYTCSVCGHSYKDQITNPTGHSYKTTVVKPTCTSGGYTIYTCACGDSYTADEVAALGHNYETKTVDATCTKDGSVTDTCLRCGDQKVQTIPATGHSHKAEVTAPTCTAKGYTTYTCACGDSYTADEVAALGHSFADGACSVCGEIDPDYVKPVVQPTLALKAPALEFKDMITVNAFFTAENLDDVVEMGMITYTEKVEVIDINTADHVIPGATLDQSTGRYFASSQGIHAKFIGDTVYLACYAKLTDGTYAYTKLAGYSPITYATNQLKNSTNTALKQLCAAMLNYGAAAQNYFGYNTDVLANATLTAEQIALPEAYNADMVTAAPAADAAKQGSFYNNKGFSVRKPAVSFEGAFSINYFFTPAYTPVDGVTLYYWTEADFAAAEVLTVENATGTIDMSNEGNGQYRADIEGIAAKDLSKAVYVAAVYSDGTTTWTSGVLGYSIGAYCASMAKGTDAMAELAKATAVYGYHAKAYFG